MCVEDHIGQVFHLAHKYCIIPGCDLSREMICSTASFLSQRCSEGICVHESYYTGTKASLLVMMATEHDSKLFQPEGDNGWTCGPFTILGK